MAVIASFRDEYFFLSNFYPAPIYYNGLIYPNNEAAFQAQKTFDPNERQKFTLYEPRVAKRAGKKVQLREDWEIVKYDIMKDICIQKFIQHPDLRKKLVDTGDAQLIEGNTWNDTTWGVSLRTGKGKNCLGIILMEIRSMVRLLEDGIVIR